MAKLTPPQIREKLKELKGWKIKGRLIQKNLKFKDFVETINFVNKLVPLAEKMQHHPDLDIKNYNQLTISLTTHDAGGLTKLDFELAQMIDKLQ